MADKKWSEFDLLKSVKDKNIELLTVIEDNESITGYDNKRVKLSDILDPINQKIQHLNLTIYQILTGDIDLLTIGVDTLPKPWYENTSVPGDTLLVELSIAKDLKREIDSTVTKVETLENEVVDIKTNIEEIVGDVLINKTNIEVLGDLVDIIKNNYYNKNDILNEVLPDIDDKAPSSEAVFNFVDLTKNTIEYNINNEVLQINNTIEDKSLENKNYTDIEIQKILNKITNLEFDSFYFDNNAKDGEFCVDYDIESVVINKSTQKIFVVEDNKLYKELSLNRPEVLEIANEVVDLHRDHVVKEFDDDEGLYKFYGSDQHSAYNGKYVGKTNYPSFVYSDVTPFVFLVSEVTDSYLFSSNPGSLTSDFYAIIDPHTTKCSLDHNGEIQEGTFLKCVKSEYLNLFSSPFIVKCEFDSSKNVLKFNIRYYSYFTDFKKLENLAGILKANVKELQFDICKDFHLSNTSEVFNDYKQTVPPGYDYFHSVNNLNNLFYSAQYIYKDVVLKPFITSTRTISTTTYYDTYALICETVDGKDLLEYEGYYLYLPIGEFRDEFIYKKVNVRYGTETESLTNFKDCFVNQNYPTTNYYLIQKGFNENTGRTVSIIILGYNLERYDGIYTSVASMYTTLDGASGLKINYDYLPIKYESALITTSFPTPDFYAYSDIKYEKNTPSFITGENNLWRPGEFIMGDNNIPTHSIFTIGHKKQEVYVRDHIDPQKSEYFFNRDNIFEIAQNGLIFIKSPKNLSRWWYDSENNVYTNKKSEESNNHEVFCLEYRCLQKILIDLKEEINSLETWIETHSNDINNLYNEIGKIKRHVDMT